MSEDRIWTAALLVIGDEILSGRTQDKNVVQVATWLNRQGIRLAEVRIVADDQAQIAAAVNELRGAYDYLFTTGGIGPTHDDISVDSIAAALGVPVVVHPRAREILEKYYAPVLDAPSYISKTGLRWPPAQRADGEQRLRAVPPATMQYDSRADAAEGRHFIRVWSPVLFWLAVIVSLTAILLTCIWCDQRTGGADLNSKDAATEP